MAGRQQMLTIKVNFLAALHCLLDKMYTLSLILIRSKKMKVIF